MEAVASLPLIRVLEAMVQTISF